MSKMAIDFELPGFRFHPTEEELLDFYLKSMIYGSRLRFDIIGFLNIYRHDPWDLPGLSKIGEREWYFFVPRDRKHGSGGRPNRTTETGFWKATGSDRKIFSLSEPKRIIGLRKTLVFYRGKAPRGSKTDWVMNEYRLPDNCHQPKEIVLCKIYRKATPLKMLEERAAKEEELRTTIQASSPSPLSSLETISFPSPNQEDLTLTHQMMFEKESKETQMAAEVNYSNDQETEMRKGSLTSLQLPFGKDKLPDLQVPKMAMEWSFQDPFSNLSPWPLNLTPCTIGNILNF